MQCAFYKSKSKAFYSLNDEYRREILKEYPNAGKRPFAKEDALCRKKEYFKECRRLSLKNIKKIPGIELRKFNEFDVDHIVPISYGYKKKIPVELIGSVENMRIIPHKDNLSKSDKLTELAARLLLRWGIWESKGKAFTVQ